MRDFCQGFPGTSPGRPRRWSSAFGKPNLPELAHQKTVRRHNQEHVPCLALAIAWLTVTHAKLLLAVPMKGLRARPTLPVNTQYPVRFPGDPVRHQHLARACSPLLAPQHKNQHLVIQLSFSP